MKLVLGFVLGYDLQITGDTLESRVFCQYHGPILVQRFPDPNKSQASQKLMPRSLGSYCTRARSA